MPKILQSVRHVVHPQVRQTCRRVLEPPGGIEKHSTTSCRARRWPATPDFEGEFCAQVLAIKQQIVIRVCTSLGRG